MAKPELLKHRVFVDAALEPGDQYLLPVETNHYLRNVVRVKTGTSLLSFDNSGREFVCEYQTDSKKSGKLIVGKCSREHTVDTPDLELGICLLKGSAFDYSLQKITELGATAIWPLISARSEVRLSPERVTRKMVHWQAVVTSAAEQCGRLTVPQIGTPQPLEHYVKSTQIEQRFVLEPTANTPMSRVDARSTALLIGPEGGFTKQEIELCKQNKFHGWRLGSRILRADTAGVAALAALQQLLGWPD